jgi:hypothetical protein
VNCPSCQAQNNNDAARYCFHCKRELPGDYTNPLGWWQVSTEGDVEGRSTRDLGTFYGYLDEIARVLSSKAYYALRFRKIRNMDLPAQGGEPRPKVDISFDIDSNTWDMPADRRAEYLRQILAGRPVNVATGSNYASVELNFLGPPPQPSGGVISAHHPSRLEMAAEDL